MNVQEVEFALAGLWDNKSKFYYQFFFQESNNPKSSINNLLLMEKSTGRTVEAQFFIGKAGEEYSLHIILSEIKQWVLKFVQAPNPRSQSFQATNEDGTLVTFERIAFPTLQP